MNLHPHHEEVADLLTEFRDIMTLVALVSSIMANPNTPPLLARVLAVICQHTAMAWADVLTVERNWRWAMSTKSNKPSVKTVAEVAAEADFQLDCALTFLQQIGAIARAMQRNIDNNQASDNEHLVGLCGYLADNAAEGIEQSIADFRALSVNVVRGAV